MPAERSRDASDQSGLVEAAEAFAAELSAFGKLAEAARALSLDSQKGLQRAARLYQDIGACEARLGAAGQALVSAIGQARETQQTQAGLIQERAGEIQERAELAADLLGRYGTLGEEAAQASALAQQVVANQDEPGRNATLLELHERLAQLCGGAQALTEAAKQAGFGDIMRQADTLRQQLLSVRSKVATLSAVERGVGQA